MKLFILAILGTLGLFAQAPSIYSNDGQWKYLGKLSSNRYDADSTSNPYGMYGSKYSADSINNPYGMYGSKYSPYSPNNPYTTQAPILVAPAPSYNYNYYSAPRVPSYYRWYGRR